MVECFYASSSVLHLHPSIRWNLLFAVVMPSYRSKRLSARQVFLQ
jgi:hypothetical protein